MDINLWIERAESLNCPYIVVIFDLQSREEYPLYFYEKKFNKLFRNISIKEGRQTISDIIKV